MGKEKYQDKIFTPCYYTIVVSSYHNAFILPSLLSNQERSSLKENNITYYTIRRNKWINSRKKN